MIDAEKTKKPFSFRPDPETAQLLDRWRKRNFSKTEVIKRGVKLFDEYMAQVYDRVTSETETKRFLDRKIGRTQL
jgi:hypothetical protein